MKNTKKLSAQSGFTLIEVMLATTILAIGLLTIGAAFAQGLRILVDAPNQMAAKELAAELLDDLTTTIETGSTALDASGNRRSVDAEARALNGLYNRNGINFKCDTVVRANGLASWDVEMTISYDSGGRNHRYVKTTVISDNSSFVK